MSKEMTFEEVDQIVERMEAAAFARADAPQQNLSDVVAQICKIIAVVKPILKFVIKVLPKKWRMIVERLIDLLDTLCQLA